MIYGLERLSEYPGFTHIIVTADQESCEAAARIEPSVPCVALVGGPDQVSNDDLSKFEGRFVCLVPGTSLENLRALRGWYRGNDELVEGLGHRLLAAGARVIMIDASADIGD